MKKSLRIVALAGVGVLCVTISSVLASCDTRPEIMIWGPGDHEAIYLEAADKFAAENDWDVKFAYAGNGDSGAYSAMSTDVTTGAAVYTYANDMLANLNRIGAVAPILGENLEWVKANNVESSVEAGKIGDTYYGYPVTADNGYFLYYNQEAFEGTAVWDEETNDLKAGFTFEDLYDALDEHPEGDAWRDGLVTWAMGDSWYVSGMFFGTGGDYSIEYDDEGNQTSAECWFAYTTDESGKEDYTVGLEAAACMRNSIMQDGSISRHFVYSDGSSEPLNDKITMYIADDVATPLAAAVCGTWKAKEITAAWGDNARATVLPTLVGRTGMTYKFTTFAGYKLMGVNRMCSYATQSQENLQMLHKFAQYLTDTDMAIARYESTGAGPSNIAAQANEEIAKDYALVALNEQYDVAYHVQGSVPANYWTPIQNFAAAMYNDLLTGGTTYVNDATLMRELKTMQNSIISATQ